MLALVMQDGERRMFGLRTGHGHYDGEHAATARRAALYGRMLMPAALVAFARRGFDGVVLAGVCVADNGGGSVQEGEAAVRARARSALGRHREPADRDVAEVLRPAHDGRAVRAHAGRGRGVEGAGVPERTLTDMEPRPADLPAVRWFADLVLVGNRFVLVRPGSSIRPTRSWAPSPRRASPRSSTAPSAFLLEGEPPSSE